MTYPTPVPPQQPAWPPVPPVIHSPFCAPSSFSPQSFLTQPAGQLGYGVGPQAFSPGHPPAQPPRPRRKWLLAGVGALTVAVVAAAVVAGMWFVNADNESDAIVTLVGEFAAAADTGDPAAVVGYLCKPEADALTKVMRVAAAATDTTSAKAVIGATDVVVKGELASAMLTESGQHKNTVYFRKEAGQWKVCMSAEKDFQAAG